MPARQFVPRYTIPLLVGLLAQTVVSLIALTPPVAAVIAAPDFGISTVDVGLFSTLLFVTAMVSASLGGDLVKRLGAIRVNQLCLLAAAIGITLVATGNLVLAALGALLVGIGYGPMTPAGSHILVDVTNNQNRPLVFSIKQTSIPLGGVLAGIFVPAIIDVADWQIAALTMAALALIFAILLQPLRRRYDANRDPQLPLNFHMVRVLKRGLRQPRLRALSFATIGYSGIQICFNAFFVIYLVEHAQLSLIQAGMIFTVAQIAGVSWRIIWGMVAERLTSTRRLLILLGVVMVAATLTTATVDSTWSIGWLMLLGICFGSAATGWNGLYLAEIVHVTSPAETAEATGVSLFFTFGGMVVAPAFFSGVVYLTGSFATAFVVLAVVALPSVYLMARGPRNPQDR